MTGATYSTGHYTLYQETKDKNLFEEIVDQMIIDQVPGMNDSFREKISLLDRDKKRMAILSLLDKDRNLFLKIKGLINKDINKMDHIKDVVSMLREYVKVGDVERKKFGEVMTPLELVKDMLATLPEEVWSNPNLKWLDPANGTGPYPIMVIYKLMIGLKDWEPDDEKRYKHIVENMIHVSELQPKNMFLYLCVVDPFDTYKLNIYTGSFLEEGFNYHIKNVWNIDNFNIILGNPPYQSNTGNVGSGHTLWDKFVLNSLEILNTDGYLVMVHPSGWRNISGSFKKIKDEFYKRNLQYLEIHNINDGLKTFNAATRYDFYCLKNSSDYDYTNIVDEDGNLQKININNLKFIPNKYFDEFIYIFKNTDNNKVIVCFSNTKYDPRKEWMSESKDFEFNLPCVKYISKVSGKIDFRYSKENKGMFGVPKVMFGIGAQVGEISIDDKGEYGLCQFVAGIADDVENLENIKKALKSDKFKDIMKACQFTTQMYNYKIINEFKKDIWKEFI